MTMKRIIALFGAALVFAAAVSCTKEQHYAETEGLQRLTFTAVHDAVSSKTALNSSYKVLWSESDSISVFSGATGSASTFKIQSIGNGGLAAVFTGLAALDKTYYALYPCQSTATISGGAITAEMPSNQGTAVAGSFGASANFAMAKVYAGDELEFKNVGGILGIKVTEPNLKRITLSSAGGEALAGKVKIEWNSGKPSVTVMNAVSSVSLDGPFTVGQTYYFCALPGTFASGFKLEFQKAARKAVMTNSKPLTLARNGNEFLGEITIPASKWEVLWPNDPEAYDYGLNVGDKHKASITKSSFELNSSNWLIGINTVDRISYGGTPSGGGLQHGSNKILSQKVASEWSTEYPNIIPSSRYFSFKINRPGTLHFYGTSASRDAIPNTDPVEYQVRVPTYYLAIIRKVNGVTQASILQTITPTEYTDGNEVANRTDSNIYSDAYAKYWISFTITGADLEGIEEAATVYLFHRNTAVNTLNVQYWPLEWTRIEDNANDPTRKPAFHLAGDSTCTQYSASSAPQTGWGQCLADSLGAGAQVNNHAVGGESTRSFIESGKWATLVAGVAKGDIVTIQFGHNDDKDKGSANQARITHPWEFLYDDNSQPIANSSYQENLIKMINDTKAKGGIPVLVTSVNRDFFTSDGKCNRTLHDYPASMRAVATATGTYLIDVEQISYDWLTALGSREASDPYYVTNKRADGSTASNPDYTHLTDKGAAVVAGWVANGLRSLGLWTW